MNLYDDFHPDVPLLLKQQEAKLGPPDPDARSGDGLGALGALRSRGRLYGLGALVKLGLHRRRLYAKTNGMLDIGLRKVCDRPLRQ